MNLAWGRGSLPGGGKGSESKVGLLTLSSVREDLIVSGSIARGSAAWIRTSLPLLGKSRQK